MTDNQNLQQFTNDDVASWDYAQMWDAFPVPARPSKEELAFLEKELQHNPHDRVLILGSTIEYRSLCKRLGIQPYVADFVRSHYDILTKYANETFEGEHFIETDWLDIDEENTYDVILGHRAINVLGKDVLPTFFEKMHKALKVGGTFYCKGNVFSGDENLNLNQLVETWAFAENRTHPLFSYIEVALYFHTADEDGYVIYPKARELTKKIYEDGKCNEEDYQLIKLLVSMSDEARFRGLIYKKELANILEKLNFTTETWQVLDEEICSNMPILVLKK